ncbi:MAG TPA: glycosyltransferase [Bryobacteraceae bacterium]|jgi:glycosyltransferase involved in cell wall biosynthesis
MIDHFTERSDTRNLCLIVPCYNEASRLDIESLQTFLDSGFCGHILFVDDGSHDNTLGVLQQLQHGYEDRTAILACRPNRGKGEAVRSGILHALDTFRPEIVGFWDADLATPLDTVYRFLHILDSRPDIEMVFGSRVKLLGRDVRRRAMRHYLGRVFATAASVMLRLPIYDTQCGAKLFRVGSHTRQLFADPFLSKWVFDVEIIARYLQLHDGDTKQLERIIYEYPLETWIDMTGSKVRPADFFTAFWDVLRIRQKYLP